MPTMGYHRAEYNHCALFYDPIVRLATVAIGGGEKLHRPIVVFADLKPGQRVLDVACGTGTLMGLMAERVGLEGEVVGVDRSPAMLKIARAKVSHAGTHFCLASAEAIPYPSRYFDRVTISFALHDMPRNGRVSVLHEIYRLLVPGGKTVIVDFAWPKGRRARLLARLFLLFESHTAVEMVKGDLAGEVKEINWTRVWRGAGYRFGQVLVGEK